MGKATVPSLQLVSSLVLAPFAICWVLRAYTADQEGATREPHEPSRNGTRKILYGPLHYRDGSARPPINPRTSTSGPVSCRPAQQRCEARRGANASPAHGPSIIHAHAHANACEKRRRRRRRPRGDWLESLLSYPHDVPTLEVDRGLSAFLFCLSVCPAIRPIHPSVPLHHDPSSPRVQSLESPPGDRAVLRCVVMPLCPGPASV